MNHEESKYYWVYKWEGDVCYKLALWSIPENKIMFRQEERMNALRLLRKHKINKLFNV